TSNLAEPKGNFHDFSPWNTAPLPAEEAIRIVPFLRHIEVQALQPAFLALGCLHATAKTGQDRRGAGDPHVRRQACDETRGAPEGPLEVHLFLVLELPGDELAENDVGVVRLCQDPVAD